MYIYGLGLSSTDKRKYIKKHKLGSNCISVVMPIPWGDGSPTKSGGIYSYC